MTTTPAEVRVDRWLCAARIFKSRTQASDACAAGHVRVNGNRIAADRRVKPGDLVEVLTEMHGEPYRRVLLVQALAERRLSPPLARQLYEDNSAPPPERKLRPARVVRDAGAGRPTKRERRATDRLRSR